MLIIITLKSLLIMAYWIKVIIKIITLSKKKKIQISNNYLKAFTH